MGEVKLLDCTLRDGGLGLEDAYYNELDVPGFSNDQRAKAIDFLVKSNVEIVELGSIKTNLKEDLSRYCVFNSIEEVSEIMPKGLGEDGPIFATMYAGPDKPYDEIPEWNPDLVKGARVILRYSELDKSLDFCEMLAKKGYLVFVQPMLTMRYSDEELMKLVTVSNKIGAYALYIVDSYGYMTPKDVERIFKIYDDNLDPSIRIGFHAHNNINMAFANAMSFIENAGDREVIVDSTMIGMGQGTGNLQTEIISDYMIRNCGKNYDYNSILEVCEIIETYINPNIWGYSVTRLLPAIHKAAYKYSFALRNVKGFTYPQMNDFFAKMPPEYKQRYTNAFLEELLNK